MKTFLGVLAIFAAFLLPSQAASIPCSGLLSDINAAGGCGDPSGVLFSSFGISGANGINVTSGQLAALTNVAASIAQSGNSVNIVFTSNPASNWILTANQQLSFNLQYKVTTTAGNVASLSAALSGNATGAGSDQVIKAVCPIAFTNGICDATMIGVIGLTLSAPSGGPVSLGNLSTFWVNENVQISGVAGSATLDSVTNSFVIPEPGTLVSLGLGLIAVGLARRKK